MKKSRPYRQYFLLTVTLCFLLSIAYSSDTLKNHELRIATIESREQINLDKFKVKSDELDLKVKQIEDRLTDDYSLLKWISIVFGTSTLIGIILIIFKFRKTASDILERKLTKVLNDKRGKLIELIHSQDEEQNIREQKNILVISSTKVANRFLLSFFDRMGFSNVIYQGENESFDVENNIDLVFFDFTMMTKGVDYANDIIAKSPKQAVFFIYADKGHIALNEKDRSSFANSKAQIYGNLINCLKYQKHLLDNE